jgi:DHA2 family multidrug resistance protein-like MFS transporter
MLPVLLVSVDMTVLGFAVPHLSADLAPTGVELLWIVDVYPFVLSGLLVTMGVLGDRVGRRRLLVVGAAAFGAASLAAAYAPTATALITARAALAVAGATLMPSTLSLLRAMFLDDRQRTFAIAAWGAAFSGGAVLGPVLGGWLLERYWWGSVFLINLPIMALLVPAVPLLVREYRDPAPGRFDLPGAVLSLAALLPFAYGVKAVARDGAAPVPLLLFALGCLAAWAFVRRQLRTAHPLIDVRLFRHRVFGTGVATNLLCVFAMTAATFALTQYLQLVLGLPPFTAGLVLVPGMVLTVLTGFAAAWLSGRVPPRALIPAGLVLMAGGFALLCVLPADGGLPLLVAAFVLVGAGSGAAQTLTNNAIMSSVPPRRAGAASAVSETAFELGGALGIAVLGSVLTTAYRQGLGAVEGVPDSALAPARETLGAALAAARALPPAEGAALGEAARTSFTAGLHTMAAIGALLLAYAAVQAAVLLRGAADQGKHGVKGGS